MSIAAALNGGVFLLVKVLADGLVVLRCRYGAAPWTLGKARKEFTCAKCFDVYRYGLPSYRPIGNTSYRFLRICSECVDTLIRERSKGGSIQASGRRR